MTRSTIVSFFCFFSLIVLNPKLANGQDLFISVRDATDLQAIVEAEILVKDENGKEVFRGKSNHKGRLFTKDVIPGKGPIDIHHPAYIDHTSDLREAHKNGFQFFTLHF